MMEAQEERTQREALMWTDRHEAGAKVGAARGDDVGAVGKGECDSEVGMDQDGEDAGVVASRRLVAAKGLHPEEVIGEELLMEPDANLAGIVGYNLSAEMAPSRLRCIQRG